MSKLIELYSGNNDLGIVNNDVYFILSVCALFIVKQLVHYIVMQICNGNTVTDPKKIPHT